MRCLIFHLSGDVCEFQKKKSAILLHAVFAAGMTGCHVLSPLHLCSPLIQIVKEGNRMHVDWSPLFNSARQLINGFLPWPDMPGSCFHILIWCDLEGHNNYDKIKGISWNLIKTTWRTSRTLLCLAPWILCCRIGKKRKKMLCSKSTRASINKEAFTLVWNDLIKIRIKGNETGGSDTCPSSPSPPATEEGAQSGVLINPEVGSSKPRVMTF